MTRGEPARNAAPLRRLQIELSEACNYRCPLCRQTTASRGRPRQLGRADLARLVAPVACSLTAVTLHGTRGEPLLHPELAECVAWLKRATRARVDLSTNGSLVTRARAGRLLDAGLDRILFAIDGLCEETYRRYRVGGSLARVLDHVAELCALKRAGGYATEVVIQLMPMAGNEHEVAELPALAARLGADEARLKLSASVTRDPSWRPANPELHALPAPAGRPACPFGLDKLYVDAGGDCFPCCYAEDRPELALGSGLGVPLEVLYRGALARRFREPFERGAELHPFCAEHCSTRLVKRTLRWRLREAEPPALRPS